MNFFHIFENCYNQIGILNKSPCLFGNILFGVHLLILTFFPCMKVYNLTYINRLYGTYIIQFIIIRIYLFLMTVEQ